MTQERKDPFKGIPYPTSLLKLYGSFLRSAVFELLGARNYWEQTDHLPHPSLQIDLQDH